MADPIDLEIDPGPEVVMNFEPVPRGPVLTSGGAFQRSYYNWFNGQDRMLGEIVSGVNRFRQTVVNLATATETELGTLTASVEVVAEVATDAETAVATLSSEVEAARQGESSLSAKVTALSTATATVDGKLSASYSLTVDAGGRIASLKLLSNGSTSEVAFTADTFKIFNGTSNQAVFTVSGGSVNINGNLVVAGTITATQVADGALTATEMTSGTLTKVGSQSPSGTLSPTGTWATFAEAAVTTVKAPPSVKIEFRADASGTSTSEVDASILYYRVKRNGTVISAAEIILAALQERQQLPFYEGGVAQIGDYVEFTPLFDGKVSDFYIDTGASAGTNTYLIEVYRNSGTWDLSNRAMFVTANEV